MKKVRFSSPENVHEITVLLDIYEGLLPPRQKQVARLKFDEDMSVSEMSERLGISRQGCDDAIKRCVRALFSYEARLNFKSKLARMEEIVQESLKIAEGMNESNWHDFRKCLLKILKKPRVGSEIQDGI